MLISDIPFDCINQAAIQYHVPAVIIFAVLETENGKVGSAVVNKNGTVDYGPMQINSIWLNELKKYGYSIYDLQYNACLNINAGTWILAQAIANNHSIWGGIGDYHSHTYNENLSYQYKVGSFTKYLEKILSDPKQ